MDQIADDMSDLKHRMSGLEHGMVDLALGVRAAEFLGLREKSSA